MYHRVLRCIHIQQVEAIVAVVIIIIDFAPHARR